MNHQSNHDGHDKMMWLMMLMCLLPFLLVFLSGEKIGKSYIVLILLACVVGHFILMKVLGKNKDK